MDDKAWLRRTEETNPAYEAFREYLNMGPSRSCVKVAESLGKSTQLITGWSAKHDWVERVTAFDRHLAEAETDGMVHQLAACRDKNLALMDKLRGHLETRLDTFIARGEDPTIRWTQALTAMAKVEQNSLLLKDDAKTTEKLDNVMALVAKVVENAGKVPA